MTLPPSTPKQPGLVQSALRVFDLSLGQMLWSKRSIFLALAVAGPVAVAFAVRAVVLLTPAGTPLIRGARMTGPTLFGMMTWVLYIRFIVPVLGIFYGTSLIADEVEDKTITYLFTRPIRRSAVVLGKYLAFLICTVLLVLPSIIVVYFAIVPLGGGQIGEEFLRLAADLGILAVGLAAYGAVFAFAGARLKHPLIAGLVFVFGWEPGVLFFPGYLKRLTVAYYLQALVPHVMPPDSAVSSVFQILSEAPSLPESLIALASISALGIGLAGWTVGHREYVLEQ
jgi:ABC-type transport system involved in multi-copper enzyme maturation permease subunit